MAPDQDSILIGSQGEVTKEGRVSPLGLASRGLVGGIDDPVVEDPMAEAITVVGAMDANVAYILKRLVGVKMLTAAAGAAEGVLATLTLKDGDDEDTIRVDARLPGETGNNYHLQVIHKTYTVGPGKDRFTLRVYLYDDATLLEEFSNLSMDDSVDANGDRVNPRYCVDYVNARSDLIRLTNLTSATADPRPANILPVAAPMASGAGEFTVTGLRRGDAIAVAWNVTDAAPVPLAEIEAVNDDLAVMAVGATSTAAKALWLLVFPVNV